MLGIYFSGTGNTKHCVSTFVEHIDKNAVSIPLESQDSQLKIRSEKGTIVFGYPIQYSNAPIFVRDYIVKSKEIFKGKNIFIIATMGLFSGDGTGCSARLFKRCKANVSGGLHLQMPDSVCDVKALKKTLEENQEIIRRADIKIKQSALAYMNGHPTKDGLAFYHHIAGLFGQRLWFYSKTSSYSNKLKIDANKCLGCGKCISLCPLNNLEMHNNKVLSKNKCTMCYRCISLCPQKAITLTGKEIVEQCRYDKYNV